MPLRVFVAGRVEVEVDGMPVDISRLGRVGRLFYACLVCERRRPVTKEEIAEVLWGEGQLPTSWEQMLRGNASKVRLVLSAAGLDGRVALRSAFGAYQIELPADAVVDVDEAESNVELALLALGNGLADEAHELAAAAAAVAARGFLPGWSGIWVERRQAELRQLRLRALEVAANAASAGGLWAEAVAAAEEAVCVEPFRESAFQALMSAHQGAGNPAEALRAYDRCRRVLAEDLGVSPSAATEAAYRALLGEEPVAAPADAWALPLPRAVAFVPGSFLVGRRAESEVLAASLDRVGTHGHQAVLVGGEPGMGKTALVAEFARHAHAQGAVVLYGRCDEEIGVAYQPFAEALGYYVTSCPLPELSAHVATHGGELSRITPDLARRLPDAAPPAITGSEGDRYRLFAAVSALLDRACQQHPVLLMLDDLHWAAPPTLSMLRHLVRARTPSLLVVGTYRHTDVGPDHPLASTLSDLRREPGVERMMLRGLDQHGVEAFVRQAEGEAPDGSGVALARALLSRTGGNPFFVGEFLRHLAESGAIFRKAGSWSYYEDSDGLGVPEGVLDVLGRRLHRLSVAANGVLTLASVVGAEFDLHLLEAVDAGDGSTLDALDEAVGAHVVAEVGTGLYRFDHALVRDTIYSSLSATRRARLHHRVGDALAALPGDRDSRLTALAHHFAEASSDGAALKAGDSALAAARQAFGTSAWEDALSYVALGLGALPETGPEHLERRLDLLLVQWETLFITDVGLVKASAHKMLETAALLGSPETLARISSLYLLGVANDARAAELAEQALRDLGDSAPDLRARALAGLAAHHWMHGAAGAELETRDALALARASGDRDAVHAALVARKRVLVGSPHAREWLAVEDELVAMGPPSGPVAGNRWIHSMGRWRSIARLTLGNRAGCEADADALATWATEMRNSGSGRHDALWRATQALLDGRFDEVEELAHAARRFVSADPTFWLDAWAIQMARLALDRGRASEFKSEAISRPRADAVLHHPCVDGRLHPR